MNTRFLNLFLLLLMLTPSLVAQKRQRARTNYPTAELSFAGTIGNTREVYRTEYTSSYTQWENEQDYAVFSMRLGFPFAAWFAFEPELMFTFSSDQPPAHSLSANAVFTLPLRRSPLRPFLLVGYGAGNAVPQMGRVDYRSDKDPWDVRLVHAGAGLKIFLQESAFLRVEYRFQMATNEQKFGGGEYVFTTKQTVYFNDILFGVGIALY
ncbi:MAG: outer membrane beta-barrel protein [Bacteroidota bacterium]|nr:outer membrane beta-barrel protein [Bacteroidota bacterium]